VPPTVSELAYVSADGHVSMLTARLHRASTRLSEIPAMFAMRNYSRQHIFVGPAAGTFTTAIVHHYRDKVKLNIQT